jgi:putative FmdB family regulatory protein
MPTYEYLCQTCGTRFEVWQKMSDDPLTTCQACGGPVRRVLYPAGIVFKGGGFYSTDHRAAGAAANGAAATSGANDAPAADGAKDAAPGGVSNTDTKSSAATPAAPAGGSSSTSSSGSPPASGGAGH